ncbi:hypothetical protein DN545_35160, partial [Burkholderia multivorans]
DDVHVRRGRHDVHVIPEAEIDSPYPRTRAGPAFSGASTHENPAPSPLATTTEPQFSIWQSSGRSGGV